MQNDAKLLLRVQVSPHIIHFQIQKNTEMKELHVKEP